MEDINRAVSALASLIVAHNRRIGAYISLAKETSQEDVRAFCKRHVDQTKQFVSNLSTWRSAYGGYAKINDQTSSTGTWQQVRSLFGFSSGRAMIVRCEQLDRDTLKMYKSAIPCMPAAGVADLQMQAKELEKALKRLQMLESGAGTLATSKPSATIGSPPTTSAS